MATTNYPVSADDNTSLPNPGSGNFTNNPSHANLHDITQDAIKAIEAKVGIGASTPTASKVLRSSGTGTSVWGQVVAATDVATFTSAALAALVTDKTGTGLAVFGTSPTIVTPTIASFASATHDHTNAAGGGNIKETSIDWSTFSLNMKSATNSGSFAPTNSSQDLASNGVTVSFTVGSNCNAMVTVSMGVYSSADYEFRPEIRVDGVVVQTFTPAAALSNASSRANVRGFTWTVPLTTGAHTISAGVFISAGAGLSIIAGGATVSAFVLGNVTA